MFIHGSSQCLWHVYHASGTVLSIAATEWTKQNPGLPGAYILIMGERQCTSKLDKIHSKEKSKWERGIGSIGGCILV